MALFAYHTGMSAVTETIDFAGGDPADYYQVELIGGVNYAASVYGETMQGGTLRDPFLVLYDSAGNILEIADDSFAFGLDPLLQFQAPTSGTYYLGVSDNVGSGSYTFSIDHGGVPTSLTGL